MEKKFVEIVGNLLVLAKNQVQITEKEEWATIKDLPVELLQQIFSLIPLDEHDSVMLTCKHWNQACLDNVTMSNRVIAADCPADMFDWLIHKKMWKVLESVFPIYGYRERWEMVVEEMVNTSPTLAALIDERTEFPCLLHGIRHENTINKLEKWLEVGKFHTNILSDCWHFTSHYHQHQLEVILPLFLKYGWKPSLQDAMIPHVYRNFEILKTMVEAGIPIEVNCPCGPFCFNFSMILWAVKYYQPGTDLRIFQFLLDHHPKSLDMDLGEDHESGFETLLDWLEYRCPEVWDAIVPGECGHLHIFDPEASFMSDSFEEDVSESEDFESENQDYWSESEESWYTTDESQGDESESSHDL